MSPNPVTTLRALNPVVSSAAPPIDELWRRLDANPEPETQTTANPAPAARRRRSARRDAWGSRLLAGTSVAVVIAIAIGAVLVLRPSDGGPGHPATIGVAPPLSRILGVLRRPQTAADRQFRLPVGIFDSDRRPSKPHHGRVRQFTPVTSLLRVATTLPDGAPVAVVPVVIDQPAEIAWSGSRYGLAEMDGDGSACCTTAAQIEAGAAFMSSGGAGQESVGVLIVPDGVAHVRFAFPHPVTVEVQDNVAVVQTDAGLENLDRYAMTWYGPSGAVVRRFAAGRTVKPTRAQLRAMRRAVLSIAEHRHIATRPDIRAFYPLFDAGFSPTHGGSGVTAFSLWHLRLTAIPTNALSDAGTVPKYAIDPRNERLLQVATGLRLWLAAGGRICIDGVTEQDTACTSEGTPRRGLVTVPSRQPRPRVLVALVPRGNATVTVETSRGSRAVAVRDGLIVIRAAGVTAVRFRTSGGQMITQRVGSASRSG